LEKEEDESLRDVIASKLNEPETMKKIELAKKVREIEKENKRRKKMEAKCRRSKGEM
jgi:hypothetical protein